MDKKVKQSSATRGNPYGRSGAPGKKPKDPTMEDLDEIERSASARIDQARQQPGQRGGAASPQQSAAADLQAMGIDMPPPGPPRQVGPQIPGSRPRGGVAGPLPPEVTAPMARGGVAGPLPAAMTAPMARPPMPPQAPPMPQRSPQELETLRRMQALYGGG